MDLPGHRPAGRELPFTKPLLDKHSGPRRYWLHKERRYHYRREALGADFEGFELPWSVPASKTFEPTKDKPGGSEPENVNEPEKQEQMPESLLAVLCLLVLYLFYLLVTYGDSLGQLSLDPWKRP